MQGFSLICDKSGSSTHSHAEFEYHFILSGNAIIKLENEKQEQLQDTMVFLDKLDEEITWVRGHIAMNRMVINALSNHIKDLKKKIKTYQRNNH